MNKISGKNLLVLSGAFCSFYCGAAFASGQELIQFFTAFGFKGILGMILTLAIYMFMGNRIQNVSFVEKFEEPYAVFTYYCGKKLGKAYEILLVAMLYGSSITMTAGAGATFEEYFGIPNVAGRLIIVAAASATVLMGLNKIVDVLGFIGPVIIAFLVIVGVISVVNGPMTFAEGCSYAEAADMFRGASTWSLSAVKYAGYVLLTLVPIWVVCGMKSSSKKEASVSPLAQLGLFSMAFFLLFVAQIKNVEFISDAQLPNLVMAKAYLPVLSLGMAVIMLLGVYSGMVFELWCVVRKFAEEKTPRYRWVTVALAVLALVVSGLLPFNEIVNVLYSLGFWAGIALVIIIIVKTINQRREKNEEEFRT